jgi:hypothetical protein
LWLQSLAFNLNICPSAVTREQFPQKVDRIKLSRKITNHGGLYTFSAQASFLSQFTTIVVVDDDLASLTETVSQLRDRLEDPSPFQTQSSKVSYPRLSQSLCQQQQHTDVVPITSQENFLAHIN